MKGAVVMEKAQDRLEILEKIAEYERRGTFDRDVENDPPTVPLPACHHNACQQRWSSVSINPVNE